MLNLDPHKYSYTSHRNVVFAKKGMVCTSAPMASQIGLDILKNGGNAMDAAVAVAAAMPLLEPTGNGLGSDCFALIWTKGKLYGLDGSGISPKTLSAEIVKNSGHTDAVPISGWLPVMVPGAPSAWEELRKRFGTMKMTELMQPAIQYAREGYSVPVTVAKQWKDEAVRISALYEKNPKLFGPWIKSFSKNGTAYKAGETFKSEDFANTLEEMARTNCESYYRGSIMKKIVAFSDETGGYLSEDDFINYQAQWVEPITVNYKGYDVYEMPPCGHGITALMTLNMLSGLDLGKERESTDTYHKTIEALKLAFVDAKHYVSDPRTMTTKVKDMLSDEYANKRRALISEKAIMPEVGDPSCGGTIYFATADSEGNMVSFIQSNYTRFGSGVVIPDSGISLQSRGANFSLDPSSDNYLEGGKKAYHTIIPGFLVKDGQAIGPFGVMGGFMQPQGHVQMIVNTIDYHMNPQESLNAPRFQWIGGKNVQLEKEVPDHIAEQLFDRGHLIEIVESNIGMGRGQIIWRNSDGTLIGGTEPRADGSIAAW
jgi:gamma-glutamyltranspeptidase/glutathione hydrolase